MHGDAIAGGAHPLHGVDLRLAGGDHPARRADEGDAGLFASADELGPFSQEAIAGVDSLCARLFGDAQNLIPVQIAAGRLQLHALIRQADMKRTAVACVEDGDGDNAHLAARTDDAHRDSAAVGDQ